MSERVIAERPPNDGREWECQCARCGSSTTVTDCWDCGGEGWVSRYEEDPLWYDEDDLFPCSTCHGAGGWQTCLSSYGEEAREQSAPTWCEAHPMPGRESTRSGAIEWFTFARAPSSPDAGEDEKGGGTR